MSKKIIIIGGVAGGATAAARLRRLDEQAQIILLERGPYVSFANCGLPYYIGGEIEQRSQLFVAPKELIVGRYNIDVRELNEAIKIDPVAKTVEIRDIEKDETYTETYDKLLISTGSSPIVPKMPGVPGDRVFTLWNVPDTDRVYNFIQKEKPKRAVIVGGGFIGLEMAENLVLRGIEVTLVEKADQVMAPLDPDMAKLIANELADKGVTVYTGEGLASVSEDGRTVHLDTGRVLETDMVMLSIGVRPNSQLAKDAGLDMNPRGGIVVDEYMQTSNPDIYAVGDVVEVEDFNTGDRTMVPLAGPANKQGRIVAANMLGMKPETYVGTLGTSVARVFELTVASTGRNEKQLNRAGLEYGKDYLISVVHPNGHAGYYPGTRRMTLKLIFDLEGKVLGMQGVGYDGVDKRIDVVATAMHFNATVYDLINLELGYAPPYSSAKDPVNMAGYVAVNQLEGLTEAVLYPDFIKEGLQENQVWLDVREAEELMVTKYEDAVEIPLTELRERINELDPSKEYFINCQFGLRGYLAERVLKAHGYKCKNLLGGILTYKALTQDTAVQNNMAEAANASTPDSAPESAMVVGDIEPDEALNVCGLSCPGPIVQVNKKMNELSDGVLLKVTATDPGFIRDIESWCKNTGNQLVAKESKDGKYIAVLRKGTLVCSTSAPHPDPLCTKEKTMIIFDGDLDKAIASFIIATGAAAMGNKVNMFFTFWGLSVIRRNEKVKVKRDFMSKMFAAMLPRGSKKLKLSQMNMLGMGSKMIRSVMAKKGVTSLEDLIKEAQEAGVKITACQMSMDVMGLQTADLIDGVEVAGVASMLNDNDNSNMNLFI